MWKILKDNPIKISTVLTIKISTVLTIKFSTVLTIKFYLKILFRERCMDLVSFETPEEYRHFALMLHRGEKMIYNDDMMMIATFLIQTI